jgi:transposase
VRVPGTGKSRRRRAQQTRTFATTIAQLERLGDWLEGFGVTRVGMEATGVYWKPVVSVLEPRFECWLINAEHLHNVPGRKSDVIDSRWPCELLELGLVRPSFVPPPEIRRLRDPTRLRSRPRAHIPQRSSGARERLGIDDNRLRQKTRSHPIQRHPQLLSLTNDPLQHTCRFARNQPPTRSARRSARCTSSASARVNACASIA